MPDQHAIAALYETHDQAEAAVRQLQAGGIDIAGVSVIGGGGTDQTAAQYTRGGTTHHHGQHRGLWGFLSGLLADTGTFMIPGAGPIMVAGPAVGWVAAAVEDIEGDDATAVRRGLAGSGIPDTDLAHYENAIRAGSWLVILHGSSEMLQQANTALAATGAVETAEYSK